MLFNFDIIIFFYKKGCCAWCRYMENFLFKNLFLNPFFMEILLKKNSFTY